MSDVTKSMRDWLSCYRDGKMNGQTYPTNSVWTRGKGTGFPGIKQCHARGLIDSAPDATLSANGWRHDLTPNGRKLVDQLREAAINPPLSQASGEAA